MSEIKVKKKYEIEIISPVHIGSGNTLQRGIDYVVRNDKTYFIDKERVFSKFSIEDLKSISNIEHLREAFKNLFERENIEKFTLFSSNTIPKNEVREFIKDPYGNPYIPGSSIKGAIRTIILKSLAKSSSKIQETFSKLNKEISKAKKEKNKRWAKKLLQNPGETLEKEYLNVKEGREATAHFDVGRTILIRDVNFRKENLELYKVKVFSKKGELRNLLISAISLCSGSKAVSEFLIDLFLLSKIFSEYKEKILDLENEIRNFNLEWIERERNSLKIMMMRTKELEYVFKSVLDFYKELIEKTKNGEVFLHLGYGVGWRGITGGILELARAEDRKEILSNLLKTREKDFPISRRFVEMEDGTFMPMGWIKLKRIQ